MSIQNIIKISMGLGMLAFTVPCFATSPEKVAEPKPFGPTPSQPQLDWHYAEYRMFVHFGMKTFHPSGVHLGSGREDPKSYNPVKFDARQWVAAAKAGGFEGIVLTTKHHDGFCNWQTDTTDFCVKSSPWRDGKGDVVRDLIKACHEAGLSFGLYVSILDKHFEQFGAKKYKNYSDLYVEQIRELSTRYGPVEEYWFDGFKSDKLKVDYAEIAKIIEKNQPHAVVYDSGVLVKYLPERSLRWPGHHGGSRPDPEYVHKIEGTPRWYPNEPSIILQGNWFHCGTPIVSLKKFQDYYLTSTGYGVTPLMNIPPNSDGLVDDDTVKRMKEFKSWVDKLHDTDLARTKCSNISAAYIRNSDSSNFGPANLTDDNYETYCTTDDSIKSNEITIELSGKHDISGFIIQEYIPLGQRIKSYTIECRSNGKWQQVFSGKRIGYKRIILAGRTDTKNLKIPASDAVRLKVRADASPLISTFKIVGKIQ
jgi:alpha-L-fucosidase